MSNGNGNNWGVPNRPKVGLGISFPNQRDGIDGDIQIKQTNLGAKLFGKIGGAWYGAPLTATEGNPVTRIGTKLSDHLSISSDKLEFMKNSKSMLSITSTGDINMTGKIVLTSAGTRNVCIGTGNSDVGSDNISIGISAGNAIESDGLRNICIGTTAGTDVTSGDDNIFIGNEAGFTSTVATSNVAIGERAFYVGGTSILDVANVCLGFRSGYDMGGGAIGNTLIGSYSGQNITGGATGSLADYNTCIGYDAGNSITDGFKNVCVGEQANVSAASVDFEIVIGSDVTGQGEETVTIGRDNGTDFITCDYDLNNTWTKGSDERIKKDINNNDLGLSFIDKLRTVTFKKRHASEYPEEIRPDNANEQSPRTNPDKIYYGFIAQEVKVAMDEVNHPDFTMWRERPNGIQHLGEADLITPLTKAVQELSAKLDTMQTEINNLKAE